MSVRLIALLCVALAIVVAVAGCGGGGDTTAASISKAEFINEADAICKEGAKRAQSEFAAFAEESKISEGNELTTAQWEEVGTKVLVPALKQQVEEVRQLGSPAGDEAQIEAFLDGVDGAIEKLEENPKIAKSPSKLLTDAHQAIAGYGFKVCGPEK